MYAWLSSRDNETRRKREEGIRWREVVNKDEAICKLCPHEKNDCEYAAKKSRCNGRSCRHRQRRGPDRSWNNSLFKASLVKETRTHFIHGKMLTGVFPRCREWHESTCASVPQAHYRSRFSAPQVKLSVHSVP